MEPIDMIDAAKFALRDAITAVFMAPDADGKRTPSNVIQHVKSERRPCMNGSLATSRTRSTAGDSRTIYAAATGRVECWTRENSSASCSA